MINLATTISNTIKNSFRSIKAKTMGQNAGTADSITMGGTDFNPPKNMKAVFASTENSSEPVCIGYLNKSVIEGLEVGEMAFYSTDGKTPNAYVIARNNGTVDLNGNDDFAVAYNDLKNEYDKTKEVLDAILSTLQTVINEPGNGSPSAFQAAMISAVGSKTTGDISSSKVETVKLP